MKPQIILCFVIVILILIFLIFSKDCLIKCSNNENYSSKPLDNACEYNEACLWDTARWVQMKNGMEGVCTLHGIACPAFSKDHSRSIWQGLSPPMVDNEYNFIVNSKYM